MHRLSRKMTQFLILVLVALLLGTLAFALKRTYDTYTQSMVSQRQEQLLITSRAVAQNLSKGGRPGHRHGSERGAEYPGQPRRLYPGGERSGAWAWGRTTTSKSPFLPVCWWPG